MSIATAPGSIAFSPERYDHQRQRIHLIREHGADPDSERDLFMRYLSVGWTGWIRSLEPEEVPKPLAERVVSTADKVARVLGLPDMLTVCMFAPCAADHPDGAGGTVWASPIHGLHRNGELDRIHIRAGRSLLATERTTAHEVRHVWQELNGYTKATHSPRDLELDAYWFEQQWMEGKR